MTAMVLLLNMSAVAQVALLPMRQTFNKVVAGTAMIDPMVAVLMPLIWVNGWFTPIVPFATAYRIRFCCSPHASSA